MTINEYGRNNYWHYSINVLMTVSFCATIIIAYVKTNPWITSFVIIYIALFLYFILIKPAIKIYEGAANTEDLNVIGIFPILGLFRKWCPVYQDMARKLEDAKVIRECEHVLKEMDYDFVKEITNYLDWFYDLEHGYTTEVLGNEPRLPPVKQQSFELAVNNFYKLFPKIDCTPENYKQRQQILHTMLRFVIYYYHNELLNDFEQKLEYMGNGYLVTKVDMVECLRRKKAKFVLHRNPDVSERAFKKELERKVGLLRALLNDLEEDEADPTVIFNQMKME